MTQAQKLADLSQAYTAGALALRNRLLNGFFMVAQRGTDFTIGTGGVTQGQITADCWHCNSSVGSRVAFGPNGITMLRETGAGAVEVYNRIGAADWTDMIGRQITLSFQMIRTAASSAAGPISLAASVLTTDGENDFVNAAAPIPATQFTNSANSVFETFSVTGSIPPTSTQKGMYIDLVANNVGSLASGQYLFVRKIQLEVGPIATPYEFRHYAFELALCQRRYELGFGFLQVQNSGASNAAYGATLPYKATKRAVPTVTPVGTPTYMNSSGLVLNALAGTVDALNFNFTANAGSNAYVGFNWASSAEL